MSGHFLRRYDRLGSIREGGAKDQIQVGDIILDTGAKQLIVRGERVRLTATEFKILFVLMSNPGAGSIQQKKSMNGFGKVMPMLWKTQLWFTLAASGKSWSLTRKSRNI